MTYQEQWDNYRRRRRLIWLVGIFYLPVLGTVMEHTRIDGLYVFVSFAVAVAASGLWFTSWPCPKCRQPWSGSMFPNPLFKSKCAHCGFPKWELEQDDESVQPEPESDVANRALTQASAGETLKGSRRDKYILSALIVGLVIHAATRAALWWLNQ